MLINNKNILGVYRCAVLAYSHTCACFKQFLPTFALGCRSSYSHKKKMVRACYLTFPIISMGSYYSLLAESLAKVDVNKPLCVQSAI